MTGAEAFPSLRRILQTRRAGEVKCEICGGQMRGEHPHLLDLKTRRIVCGCSACAVLFSDSASQSYRRIPEAVRSLRNFTITDAQWSALDIPIGLAFFCLRGASADSLAGFDSSPEAFYPSPAGATQSAISREAWQEIAVQNPILRELQPDVECLLANRIAAPHLYFIAPIDECYRLVGLIRSKWRGISGGSEVWQAIHSFFDALKERSAPFPKMRDA